MENRVIKYDILDEIKNRWSPRAFSRDELSMEDIFGILEAARFAPSCFNEQPWRFVLAISQEDRTKMVSILSDSNKLWADKAPVLLLILAKKNFDYNGKENRWSSFDCGTFWGFLSLEANRRGLITHAMAGFNVIKAREVFKITEEYMPMTVVALGKHGNPEELSDDLKKREVPSTRKETKELIYK